MSSENKYQITVGLEIHVELKTKTKMFCNSRNNSEEKRPNFNICPICLAHPGTLPTINKEAVLNIIKVGLAVGGKIANFTEFDRKSYFYPDIPKGYQISQYKYPIVSGGNLKGVQLTRIHLEEDTATSKHDRGDFSLLDFNRAGLPLMELVTEPVIKDAKEAVLFAKELQLLLRFLGIAEASMEKGQMRVEVNISVSKEKGKLGTKVEVKNLNSFRVVEKAINFEMERQINLLEKGEKVIQETRGWNEKTNTTFSQRKKEDSHDYRYFPEPDLPKLFLEEIFNLTEIKNDLPELPKDKRERFKKDYGIKEEDIEVYVNDFILASFFENIVKNNFSEDFEKIKLVSNYITNDLVGLQKNLPTHIIDLIDEKAFAEIIKMLNSQEISSRGAKDLLIKMADGSFINGDIRLFAEKEGLIQTNNEAGLEAIVKEVIINNPTIVTDYKGGKENLIQFLIGQVMKNSKGGANPQLIKEILIKMLK